MQATSDMADSLLKHFARSSQLGAYAAYLEDLYEQYLAAPDSVGAQWKRYFDEFKGRQAGDVPHSAIAEAVADAGRKARRGQLSAGAGAVFSAGAVLGWTFSTTGAATGSVFGSASTYREVVSSMDFVFRKRMLAKLLSLNSFRNCFWLAVG